MTSLIQEYITLHNGYTRQYGDHCVILMQVGSFFEMYSACGNGPNIAEISNLMNIQHTHRDKSKQESIGNPSVCGFQLNSLDKYMEILTNNDYTVIIYEQMTTSTKGKMDRKLTGIYTKGTYISNNQKNANNYLMCLYIINEQQRPSGTLKSVGMSCVDLSTGQIYAHEAHSEKYDQHVALDEASRFINNTTPSEILIFYDDQTCKKGQPQQSQKDYFYGYLNIDENKCRYSQTIDEKYSKLSFQNEFLGKIYSKINTAISPIESLDLENYPHTIKSLCLLFDFVYDKMPHLLKNISEPEFCFDNMHLVLGNNAIHQLDIFENPQNAAYKTKYRSLFNIVNETKTPLGERYLRNMLSSPLTGKTQLNRIYNMTQKMIDTKIPVKIREHLLSIRDIERFARRIELKMLRPYELSLFISSYEHINEIVTIVKKDFPTLIYNSMVTGIKNFLDHCTTIFNIENLALCTDLEFNKKIAIFNEDIHEDIDAINNNINAGASSIDDLKNALNDLFPKSKNAANKITVKHNNKDGYYLHLSKKNGTMLQKILNENIITIGDTTIKNEDIVFTYNKDTTKVTIPSLDEHTDNMEEYADLISQSYRKYYLEDIAEIHEKFASIFMLCNDFVTQVDYLQSNAMVASEYGYCRPTIKSTAVKKQSNDSDDSDTSCNNNNADHSYVIANGLRHPIVERLIDHEYVPHDIAIGTTDLKGMLIYGLNSSGKSVLMKAVGLSIIMAQCGLFVPANSFEYVPYKSIMTRISGSDNIFKGLSSFAVEMTEINSILKRSNKNTLIIGDEIARGTEAVSANAIVASTIIKLHKLSPTFIFTTHLHELMSLDEIKEIPTVKAYHLKVSYDQTSKTLIYNRKLEPGCGESIYGITVAKYIIQDTEFIDQATIIKNKLLNIHDTMISGKVSRYNKDLYIHECAICGEKDNAKLTNLESHHINFQKDCDENDVVKNKKHLKKNDLANLIILCNKCHDKLHNCEFEISGYEKTISGKKLVHT